jgi:hypothetical protein
MDFSCPRTEFIPRKLLYACSFDCTLRFPWTPPWWTPGSRLRLSEVDTRKHRAAHFYHALSATSVDGVDGRRHLVPHGHFAKNTVDSFKLDAEGRTASVKGRFSEPTPLDAEGRNDLPRDLTIAYEGMVSLHGYFSTLVHACPFMAKSQLVLSFTTNDTRFRWLVEHGMIAFSTWTFTREGQADHCKIEVTADVYSAG